MSDFDETEELLNSLSNPKKTVSQRSDNSDLDDLLSDISNMKITPGKESELQKIERELKSSVPKKIPNQNKPSPSTAYRPSIQKSQENAKWDQLGNIISSLKGEDPPPISISNPPKAKWEDLDNILTSVSTQFGNSPNNLPMNQSIQSPKISGLYSYATPGDSIESSLDHLDKLLNPERYEKKAPTSMSTPTIPLSNSTNSITATASSSFLNSFSEKIYSQDPVEGEEGIIAAIRAMNNPVLPTPKFFDIRKFGDGPKQYAKEFLTLVQQNPQNMDYLAVSRNIINTVRSIHDNIALIDESIRDRVVIKTQNFANVGLEFTKLVKTLSPSPTSEQLSEFERLENEVKTSLSEVLALVKEINVVQANAEPSDGANRVLEIIDTLEEQLNQTLIISASEFLGLERIRVAFKEVFESNPFDFDKLGNILKDSITKARALISSPTPKTQLLNASQSLLSGCKAFILTLVNFQYEVKSSAVVASKKAVLNSCNVFVPELEKAVKESLRNCSKCSKLILAQYVTVGTQFYHTTCLACSVCGKQQTICYRFKTELFCEEHYLSLTEKLGLNLICTGCKKPLSDRFIQVGSRGWHHECFKCEGCQVLLIKDFYTKNDKIYCEPCDRKFNF